MTSDGTEEETAVSVAAAMAAWAAEPRLSAILHAADGCYLVLSGDGERVLHASASAKPLAEGISDDTGRIFASLGLVGHMVRAGFRGDAPSLLRLQLDTRRIAPPVTCLAAGGLSDAGLPVRLLAFDRPVTVRRRRPRSEPVPEPTPDRPLPVWRQEEPEPDLVAGARFVWRSDAEGRFGDAFGHPSFALRTTFAGQGWASLAASGRLMESAALLAALEAGRTFRAVPVVLSMQEQRLDLDVSGAPLARAGRPFEGFSGFGLIRSVTPCTPADADPVPDPAPPPTDEAAAADLSSRVLSSEAVAASTSAEPLSDLAAGVADEPDVASPIPGELSDRATDPADSPAENVASAEVPGSADAAPEGGLFEGSQRPSRGTMPERPENAEPLSVNEHAAFREIAKALGARFAGDDEEPADARSDTVAGFRASGGSVTPFPTRPVEPAVDATALLDGIPACLLVCRGESLLHANRPLLDLAGFPDLATLQAEGGLSRLFRGLPPQRHAGAVFAVAMATRDGRACDTELEHARIGWLGESAECLLVRPLPVGDAMRRSAAAVVSDGFASERAAEAEAALDAVEDAVVALDRGGRILSLNRAAASAFRCEPREVVGGAFADLFSPRSAALVRILVRETVADAQEVSIGSADAGQLRLLTITPPRLNGRRVAVLRIPAAPAPTVVSRVHSAETTAGEASGFAERVGRELRAPATGIVGSTDLILAERYGPLGDERYRGTVHDIRASGEQVLALVDDLVELSQIETGERELVFEPLSLNDLVAECVAHLQGQAVAGRVLLRTSFAADLGAIVADASSLRQATLAAIAGAIRETAAGGQVIVSTTQAERGDVALRVRDTGPGIVAPTGEPIQIAADAASRRGAGVAGLGAPLTRALVEANHGRFRISSRKDEGTLVELLFSTRGAAIRA